MAPTIDVELEKLKADFATLNQSVGDLARDVKALLATTLQGGEDKARASVRDTVEELKERLQESRGRGRRYVEAGEQQIGEHPYTALITAFGLGFIIAKLLDLGHHH
ncbi:MAG: hypothetical protein MUF20_08710 [Methylotetracoccus sp.]|jgi:ElaB/YqjD/DUF883 family membrane-anchored ribosome-binding protein|nr:hypothetical protein [Methylotetracoccus sp.]